MDRNLDSIGIGYRLCILGDLTGAFGVSRENDNGRRVEEFYAERELYVGNTF